MRIGTKALARAAAELGESAPQSHLIARAQELEMSSSDSDGKSSGLAGAAAGGGNSGSEAGSRSRSTTIGGDVRSQTPRTTGRRRAMSSVASEPRGLRSRKHSVVAARVRADSVAAAGDTRVVPFDSRDEALLQAMG